MRFLDPWLRAHLPALDAAVTRRFVQLVTGIFEQRSLLLSTLAESTAFAGGPAHMRVADPEIGNKKSEDIMLCYLHNITTWFALDVPPHCVGVREAKIAARLAGGSVGRRYRIGEVIRAGPPILIALL